MRIIPEPQQRLIRRASGRRERNRRGISLVIVMLSISTSLVLTYSFLRTQANFTELETARSRSQSALEAARYGAAVGWRHLQSESWAGMEDVIQETISTTADGTLRCTVSFRPLPDALREAMEYHHGLYVVIESLGTYQANDQVGQTQRQVQIIAQLNPRLDPNPESVSDVSANEPGFDEQTRYSVYTSSGTRSLVIDPLSRIVGDVRLERDMVLFQDPAWSSSVRQAVLQSFGNELVFDGQALHPHPLDGTLFNHNPSSPDSLRPVEWLRVPVQPVGAGPDPQRPAALETLTYRLFRGGPEYKAVRLYNYQQNVHLKPTPENPAGLFYCSGNLTLYSNVIVQGTLYVTDRLRVSGTNVVLNSFNWLGEDGQPLVPDHTNWPRLPAVIADRVDSGRNIRVVIEGAVITRQGFRGAGADYDWYNDVSAINLNAVGKARPLEQPYSLVRLETPISLPSNTAEGAYAVWIPRGRSGDWYPILKVGNGGRELKILGESTTEGAVNVRIQPSRLRFTDIRGQVVGTQHDINRPGAWVLNEEIWTTLYTRWDSENFERESEGRPPVSLLSWLQDPANFKGWGAPYERFGLIAEPTFHVHPQTDVRLRSSLPLFAPGGLAEAPPEIGYDWSVVSWKER